MRYFNLDTIKWVIYHNNHISTRKIITTKIIDKLIELNEL